MPSHEELSAAITTVWQEVQEWGAEEGPFVDENGEPVPPAEIKERQRRRQTLRPAISERLRAEVEAVLGLCLTDEYERQSWPAVLSLDEFRGNWLDWNVAFAKNPKDTRADGDKAMWRALEKAHERLDTPRRPAMEPPHQLASMTPPAHPPQIAEMYGWWSLDANGRRWPDVGKVEAELARYNASPRQPYEHYRPDMPHPCDVEDREETEAAWRARCERLGVEIAEAKETEAAKTRDAPEPFADNATLPGMCLNQLRAMYPSMTRAQIEDKCQELIVAGKLMAMPPELPIMGGKKAATPELLAESVEESRQHRAAAANATAPKAASEPQSEHTLKAKPVAETASVDTEMAMHVLGHEPRNENEWIVALTETGHKPAQIAAYLAGETGEKWNAMKVGRRLAKLQQAAK